MLRSATQVSTISIGCGGLGFRVIYRGYNYKRDACKIWEFPKIGDPYIVP